MAQIDAAIAHLEAQEELNYTEAGKLFGVHRTTLMRRYTRKTRSRAEANSNCRQRLNDVQEDTLLGYINTLTKRHIPPTSQIIRNLAEEMLKGPVGKNWTGNFIKRHSQRICSVYLDPLDRARVSAESVPVFEQFYASVLPCFFVLWILC
jgi:Tc5 transposase DNA-binding domain